MRRALWVALIAALPAALALAQSDSASKQAPNRIPLSPAAERALVDQYCVGCHNQKAKFGGLALDAVDLARAGDNAETLEKVIRKLRAGMMPPLPARGVRIRPPTRRFAPASRTASIRRPAPSPQWSRPEFTESIGPSIANSVRDLLGLEIDPAAFLPVDDASSGFDNLAGSLTLSPALVEGYLSAAGKISRLALGHETGLTEKR